MKTITLSVFAVFFTAIVFAQEVKFQRPDFNAIEKAITNKKSGFYYNDLLDRLKKEIQL